MRNMTFDADLSNQLLFLSALILIFYAAYGAFYRLYLSPVAKFPGPKLAGLTFWYEFYYDVIKRGNYTFKIRELHKQYGPIIRINPYELHIDDPDFYDVLYSGPSQRRDKWPWSVAMFNMSTSTLTTIDHDHHRVRQKALLPFFSQKSVSQLEPLIQRVLDSLCANMERHRQEQKPVNLLYAFSSASTDVISQYSFGHCNRDVEKEEFFPESYHTIMITSELALFLKQCVWVYPLVVAMPEWIVKNTAKSIFVLWKLQKGLEVQVQGILDGTDKPSEGAPNRTIFHEILDSSLPMHEKRKERLMHEAHLIMAAGSITVTHMLKLTFFYILENPEIAQKLKAELQSAIPDASQPAPLVELRKLPYLTAVINEGLRMSYGVSHRLQRIKPDGDLTFRQWSIPAGTPVGMTAVMMHENPTIFPNPREFQPERWLHNEGTRLEKYLVPFSRGTRACIGMNLAYAEMYMGLATVLRRFDLELFETTRADVDLAHDFFNPSVRLDSKGIRAMVTGSALKQG